MKKQDYKQPRIKVLMLSNALMLGTESGQSREGELDGRTSDNPPGAKGFFGFDETSSSHIDWDEENDY